MRYLLVPICVVLCLSVFVPAASSKDIRVAAWNIEHFRDQNLEGPNPRTDADYERLAKYVAQMDADIVGLQEVEGTSAAQRIFPPGHYDFYFSSRSHSMLTGFAVRKGITVTQNPDYQALNVSGGERYGTDITVDVDGQKVRMLSVHLHAGCWQDDIDSLKEACVILKEQMVELERWIDQRALEGLPFVIMGDFNRRFDVPDDDFWQEIDDSNPPNADLYRVTQGLDSGCWVGHYPPQYIDHIVLDKQATGWIVPGSFQQIVYAEGDELKEELSDHCPLSVVISIPSQLSPPGNLRTNAPSTPSAPSNLRPVTSEAPSPPGNLRPTQ